MRKWRTDNGSLEFGKFSSGVVSTLGLLSTLISFKQLEMCRENDGDIKRHGPESPPGISESSKGFREMSTGLTALNKSSLKKMKMKMGS
ncbi:hypothetical protein QYF36_018971 [Acer negundo]|nr:hypothetical protein QYF36_018971 [Acer negundo]